MSVGKEGGLTSTIWLLDYGAGNVCSLVNAFAAVGKRVSLVQSPQDIVNAKVLVFPGVGSFGACMKSLQEKGYIQPLLNYLLSGKPFLGICLGMQALFQSSEESPDVPGLGLFPGNVTKFSSQLTPAVPHMGWNKVVPVTPSAVFTPEIAARSFYFVHSYHVASSEHALATTSYGETSYVSAVQRGNIFATQFHPEKSGTAGLTLLESFIKFASQPSPSVLHVATTTESKPVEANTLAKRIIACLDVRSDDYGQLVVTKGDQYNVRERSEDSKGHGSPLEMAEQYYLSGADEITFLNITSFRSCLLQDLPILTLLHETSQRVFVPLTIGGGIRDFVDSDVHTAMQIVDAYFRAGADKVSIGSDAVLAAEAYWANSRRQTTIEQISERYGSQAVVVSVDPVRVYVADPSTCSQHVVKHREAGPNGEEYCWYQCTTKGGRERRTLDVKQLAIAMQDLGAGELLLNCIDRDGTKKGFDIDLIQDVKSYVSIPVIASSGAGEAKHFSELFKECPAVEAALAAGIFHRNEVTISEVKHEVHAHTHFVVRM